MEKILTKQEYIKILKQLIKKYHPDLCNNEYLQSAYNEITVKLIQRLNRIKRLNQIEIPGLQDIKAAANHGSAAANQNDQKKLTALSEQDYRYYRLGIKYYKNIHPDKLFKKNPDTTYESKKYDELLSALNNIYMSFNLSQYYFKKVIDDYPDSPYAHDAGQKIRLLKKLFKSYDNVSMDADRIVDSREFVSAMGLKMME
ncbi:MAG: hypothetical protein FWD78_13380 [Treponema sp.]|nr:hypothetical protein [Treponema sp.]